MSVTSYAKEERESMVQFILLEFGDFVTLEQLRNASDKEIECMCDEINKLLSLECLDEY
jgi:hypothetical protein